MSNFQIRRAERPDNQPLARMIRGVFEEHDAPRIGTVYSDPTTDALFELFEKQGAVLWVAMHEGALVGCCGIYPTEGLQPDTAELVKFYLQASARNKGIGRALMQQSMDAALAMGYKKVYIESLPHFAKAVHIYEKLGFRHLTHPLGNSGHPTCNIWMLKDIAD